MVFFMQCRKFGKQPEAQKEINRSALCPILYWLKHFIFFFISGCLKTIFQLEIFRIKNIASCVNDFYGWEFMMNNPVMYKVYAVIFNCWSDVHVQVYIAWLC